MKKIFSILFVLFSFSSVYAQSSEVITKILNSDEATIGQICYLSAVYQGFVKEDASYAQAVQALYDKRQIPAKVFENEVVVMVNLAYIYSQMWNVKGGLMYRITHGSPRYAFKQMKADGIIPDNASPNSVVTGQTALNMFTACSIEYGKEKLVIDEE